jgi:hypothetical protein
LTGNTFLEPVPQQQLGAVGLEAFEPVPVPPIGFARALERHRRGIAADQPAAQAQGLPPLVGTEALVHGVALRRIGLGLHPGQDRMRRRQHLIAQADEMGLEQIAQRK